MPSKRKQPFGAKPVPELTIPAALLDQVVKGPMTQDEVEAVCRSLKKAVIERAMGGEMTHHLGYSPGGVKPARQASHRNGTTGKTVITDDGPVRIGVPGDCDGSFEPQIIPKHVNRRAILTGEVRRNTWTGKQRFPTFCGARLGYRNPARS